MKTPKDLVQRAAILVSSLFLFVISVQAQEANEIKRDEPTVQQLLESKEFIFRAQSVNPMRGGYRQLTSEFDLRLLGDSLVSYLPYFGRAYSAPIDPRQNGLQFTSTDFEYKLTPKKKGWDVQVKPADVTNIQQLTLNVTTTGRATLQVISTNREAISFNGVIVKRR